MQSLFTWCYSKIIWLFALEGGWCVFFGHFISWFPAPFSPASFIFHPGGLTDADPDVETGAKFALSPGWVHVDYTEILYTDDTLNDSRSLHWEMESLNFKHYIHFKRVAFGYLFGVPGIGWVEGFLPRIPRVPWKWKSFAPEPSVGGTTFTGQRGADVRSETPWKFKIPPNMMVNKIRETFPVPVRCKWTVRLWTWCLRGRAVKLRDCTFFYETYDTLLGPHPDVKKQCSVWFDGFWKLWSFKLQRCLLYVISNLVMESCPCLSRSGYWGVPGRVFWQNVPPSWHQLVGEWGFKNFYIWVKFVIDELWR